MKSGRNNGKMVLPMKKHVIVFEPSGLRISVDEGSTILEAIRNTGLHVNSECGGTGSCGKCCVILHPLQNPGSQDSEHVSSADLELGVRLACQHTVQQDMRVVISEDSRDAKILIVGKPLKQHLNLDEGFENKLGAAIDLGTTTIVAYLLDLGSGVQLNQAATLNPQTKYGEDVISRITHAVQEKGGVDGLFDCVSREMNDLVLGLIEATGGKESDLARVTIVGNTAMHHFLLRSDVKSLGVSPYIPTIRDAINITGERIGLSSTPKAEVYFPPNIAGFVGGDTVAFILSQRLDLNDKVILGIDVGTNGEIVLSDCGKLSCCSAAAGSAFEGAAIRNGMRGESGAIEYISIDNPDLPPEISVIGNIAPHGLCGSAIVDITAEMKRFGLIDSGGRIQVTKSKRIFNDEEFGLSFLIANKEESDAQRDIVFTQKDIRQVQLAKGAIHAGSTILLREANLGVHDIDLVMLAGAFGSYIRPESALGIGLFPQVQVNKVIQVGNAAGEGAKALLLSSEIRRLGEKIVSDIKYVELADHEKFQSVFLESLRFPDES